MVPPCIVRSQYFPGFYNVESWQIMMAANWRCREYEGTKENKSHNRQISARFNHASLSCCTFSTKGQQRPKTPSHNPFQHVAIRPKKCDITWHNIMRSCKFIKFYRSWRRQLGIPGSRSGSSRAWWCMVLGHKCHGQNIELIGMVMHPVGIQA